MSETAPVELRPPNWAGGPPICPVKNLPAFPDKKAMSDYQAQQHPSLPYARTGKCEACGHFHGAT